MFSFLPSPRRRGSGKLINISLADLCRIPACAGMTLLLLMSVPAHADDYHYAPKDCEFRMEFPSAPLEGQRCDPDAPSHCNAITTFTHVFAMDASVNVTVTCNPAEKNMFEHYSGDVMRATLATMVGKVQLDKFETGFKQFDNAKQATIIGSGKKGQSDKIYIGQLWIGHQSVFTVEAEMVGNQLDAADQMFASILKSVRQKDWATAAIATDKTTPKKAPP